MGITIEKLLSFLVFLLGGAQIWLLIYFLFEGKFVRKWIWAAGAAVMLVCTLIEAVTPTVHGRISSCLLLVIYFATVKSPEQSHWSWSIWKYVFFRCQWAISFQVTMIVTYPWNLMSVGAERFCAITDGILLLWIILICAVYQICLRKGCWNKAEKIFRKLLVPFLVLILSILRQNTPTSKRSKSGG